MIWRKIGSLPVVDGERVVGIVTETDRLRQVVNIDARTAECEAIIVSFP
jgi:CBS domain-containing protein